MKQAQQMQQNMQKAQAELAVTEVEGQAASGMVKAVMTREHLEGSDIASKVGWMPACWILKIRTRWKICW